MIWLIGETTQIKEMWASLVPLLVWVKNRKKELFSCIKRSILTPYFLDTINYVTCFHVTHELLWQKAIAEIRKRLHNYESASTRCLSVQVYCWWRMEVCPWHSMGEWWSRKCLQHIRCAGKHLLLFFSHYACIEYLSSSMSSLEDGSPLQLYLCISLQYVQYYIRWAGPPLCSCGPKWSRMIIQWVWDQHEWATLSWIPYFAI